MHSQKYFSQIQRQTVQLTKVSTAVILCLELMLSSFNLEHICDDRYLIQDSTVHTKACSKFCDLGVTMDYIMPLL